VNPRSVSSAALLAVAVVAFPGCARRTATPAGKPVVASADAKRYPLRGVIRKVDVQKREITVEHEAVPDYMDAMTMDFPVRDDPQVFEILHSGDRIEARLVVDGGDYWLEQILTKGFVPALVGTGGPPSPSAAAGAVVTPAPNRGIAVGDPVPDFSLTDQTGHAFRLSQMRGEPVAVTFLYTRCPIATACPMTAARFAKLDSLLAEKGYGKLVTISVDPEHDTPKVLADYAKHLGANAERWRFLTGDPKAIADAASSFGVLYYPEKGTVVHTQAVAVVDPQGRLAAIYFGEHWDPADLLKDIEKARKG
jgi:protein SCO1